MMTNNSVTFSVKNSGNYIAMVKIMFNCHGSSISHNSPNIPSGVLYRAQIPKDATNIHMIFYNKSVPGSPAFDEESRAFAVASCFLLTGEATSPVCIPIPCSSYNSNCIRHTCCFRCYK